MVNKKNLSKEEKERLKNVKDHIERTHALAEVRVFELLKKNNIELKEDDEHTIERNKDKVGSAIFEHKFDSLNFVKYKLDLILTDIDYKSNLLTLMGEIGEESTKQILTVVDTLIHSVYHVFDLVKKRYEFDINLTTSPELCIYINKPHAIGIRVEKV